MKRLCTIFVLFITVLAASAQEKRMTVLSFSLDPYEMRAKTDPVYDRSGTPAAMIVIHFGSLDSISFNGNLVGQPLIEEGEYIVYMPSGSRWIEILAHDCPLLHYDFPEETPLLPSRGYVLNLEIVEANPLRTLTMPVMNFNASQLSYGLMLGIGRRNGGYLRFVSDFRFGISPAMVIASGKAKGKDAPWFTGESAKSRYSVTAGYMRQIVPSIYLYAGGGYGTRSLLWQHYEAPEQYGYAKVSDYSFSGAVAETGLILRLGPLALSAGAHTIAFKYWEASAGIGVFL